MTCGAPHKNTRGEEAKADMRFTSRETAGRELAVALSRFAGSDTIVLALPRGGVVIGAEVARALRSPLGLILVQKIGHPAFSEFAVGALAEGGKPVYNVTEVENLDEEWRLEAEKAARHLITKRKQLYFGGDGDRPEVFDKLVVLVDDGIATGLTMKSAISAVRDKQPRGLVIASPVASREGMELLDTPADQIVTLLDPIDFGGSIGGHYVQFPQVEDETVVKLMERSRAYAVQ